METPEDDFPAEFNYIPSYLFSAVTLEGELVYGYPMYDGLMQTLPNLEVTEINPHTLAKYVCDDKEGTPLYEGDIVQIESKTNQIKTGKITYDEENFQFLIFTKKSKKIYKLKIEPSKILKQKTILL